MTLIAVSRAPLAEIERLQDAHGLALSLGLVLRQRFQFRLPRLLHARRSSPSGKVFYNFSEIDATARGHDELPGLSAFYKDEAGDVFHTYSSYARGAEELIGTLMILDRAPKGRNEKTTMDFVRRHDEYGKDEKPARRARG